MKSYLKTILLFNKTELLILILLALLVFAALLSSCASADSAGGALAEAAEDGDSSLRGSYDDVGFAMGTVVTQTIYSANEDIARAILSLLSETEEKWLSWRVDDSEIAKVNAGAGSGARTEVSDETKEYIQNAVKIAADSGGAFDPTVGRLTRLWDFDSGKNEVPDEGAIREILAGIGYASVKLDGNSVSLPMGSSIDLGAMGKGIGCDEIEAYLDGLDDVRGALVNIGGSSVLTYGKKDTSEPWKVAVLDPRDANGYLGALALDGTNHVSTSADYERYFEIDGKRYHHILDPSTGYPADSGLMSVTVVMDHGAECDALSTACFVLGREKSLNLLEKYGAEAIFVDTGRNVYVTDGLKSRFTLMADGYRLV